MSTGYTDRGNGFTDPTTEAPLNGTKGTIAAAGSSRTDATAIAYAHNEVTAADGTKGVILPTVTDNSRLTTIVRVHNASASALLVYPGTAGVIDNGSANASVSIAARATGHFFLYDATSGANIWHSWESPAA
jgi:hypothetical protein